MITIRKFEAKDVARMAEIWNQVVEDGVAFPQEEGLTGAEAAEFFAAQTVSAVAEDEQGNVKGLYILHPNNIGRVGHIANASYAVDRACRGEHIGELLVKDCLEQAKANGYRVLQFNAVWLPISMRSIYTRDWDSWIWALFREASSIRTVSTRISM